MLCISLSILILLPIKTGCFFQEYFNAVIGLKSLIQAQEDENGETFQRMSHLANTLNIILVAGKYRTITQYDKTNHKALK